jgi:ketosteroid isomerase-like protein
MRPRGVVAAGLASVLLWVGGCTDRSADERAIVQGEHAWGRAFVTGDTAAVDRLLAEDFVGVDPDGAIYDKAKMLQSVRAGPNIASDQVGAVRVRFFDDTAVAQGSEHEVGPAPQSRPADRVWTDVWVRRGGRWRIEAAEDLDPRRR